jgi:hypothetical protein
MPITLGPITLEETNTSARERHDEVGGRDARTITIDGLISGSTVAQIEAGLDAILDAASAEDYTAALSLRDGRRLWVRRNKYTRELDRENLAGAFTLELEARDPFEESVDETAVNWNITASGQTQPVTPSGNVFAKPRITLVASGDIINPAFSDGTRAITYMGTVADGEELVFDAATGTATLEGADVTPYTTGLFPNLEPEGTTITYTDDASSTHTATVTIAFRDRWW